MDKTDPPPALMELTLSWGATSQQTRLFQVVVSAVKKSKQVDEMSGAFRVTSTGPTGGARSLFVEGVPARGTCPGGK